MSRSVHTFWAMLALAILCTPKASADIINLSLSVGNSAIQGVPGPYGTVQVDLTNPTNATITFTAATDMLFGDSGVVDVNVNASSWTISGLTGSGPFNGPSLTNQGAGNVDGFKGLNQTFEEFDGFMYALQTVSFVVTDTSGTWADAAAVLALNSTMTEVAAHIFICGNGPGGGTGIGSCNLSDGAFVTGYAGGNTGGPGPQPQPSPPVPEPTSILLLGTVLFGAGKLLKGRTV